MKVVWYKDKMVPANYAKTMKRQDAAIKRRKAWAASFNRWAKHDAAQHA